MRTRRVFAVAALLGGAAETHGQSATGTSRPGMDVQHYEFRIDMPATMPDTVHFVSTVTAARMANAASFALDLVAALHVDAASVNGRPAPFVREGDQVRVTLPSGSGDTLVVALRYKGIPQDGLVVRRDTLLGTWTAFGDNFPDRARQWLATVDHPSDKATVEWIVHAPATHRVIGNGELQEETPDRSLGTPRMVTTRWRTYRPIYTSVMVIGVAPFAVYELGNTACAGSELPGCVRQSVWTTPDVRDYLPGPFAKVGDIVSLFSRLVGPFPYEKLAHVQSQTRYGGMENASAIFYADGIYRRRSMSEGLLAHEIAHQWFGDAVTEREWPHVWLSEGFATYFAALWTENQQGDDAFVESLKAMRTTALQSKVSGEKAIVDRTLDDLRRVLNSNVYQKAGFVLHMLRREVGDSAFFRGIRAYYTKYRHRNALTADFMREQESASGRKLDWFFSQWFDRPGAADVTITWLWDPRARTVVLTATQANSEAAPYQLNMSVDVVDARGARQRVRVTVPAARVGTMHLPLKLTAPPASLTFDPDVSILGRVNYK